MIMKINEILDIIKELAFNQGFYGRLYRDLMIIKESDTEQWNEIKKYLENRDFRDKIDLIMHFEC